jgi:hypothetical protein
MAKRLSILNVTYTLVGFAVAGAVGYYTWRALRSRSEAAEQESLMDIRRSTRKAGRAVKDTATQVGKTLKRGAEDVGEAVEDASASGRALIEQDSTGYGSKSF